MKAKLLALFFGILPLLTYSQTCADLTINVITPNPDTAITCEPFLLKFVVHNASASAASNVQVAILFQHSAWLTTIPLRDTISGSYWIYNVGLINAHDSSMISVYVTYDCHSVHSIVSPFAANLVIDHARVYFGGVCSTDYSFSYGLANPYLNDNTASISTFWVTGNSFTSRDFILSNNGSSFNYFNKYFSFRDSLDTLCSQYLLLDSAILFRNNTPLDTFAANLAHDVVAFHLDSFPVHINQSDVIRVRELFQVIGCPQPEGKTYLSYRWGCSSDTLCGSTDVDLKIKRIEVASPRVGITRLLPNPDTMQHVWENK